MADSFGMELEQEQGGISQDIRDRLVSIERELNRVVKERPDVIHGLLVARIARLHLLMLGPGGSGKSMTVREFASHIVGGTYFETALDEATDPAFVFGPTDIKGMAEHGVARRVISGMLPEATDAFVDEIFNANPPVLHGLHGAMNERIFHNGAERLAIPLCSLYAGSNKLNADADLAPFFDRLHLRFIVNYLQGRENQKDMVTGAIARMSQVGRGGLSLVERTVVTVDELERACQEASRLGVDEAVFDAFLDLREKLLSEGIVISDRRMVDGMAAVLANAWLRNHTSVTIGDLDILASMWWTLLDHEPNARKLIMELANPTENKVRELAEEFDGIRAEFAATQSLDDTRKTHAAVEASRNSRHILDEADGLLAKARAEGMDTVRLEGLIERAMEFHLDVGAELGLPREDSRALRAAM